MLGDALLVAPALEPGCNTRSVNVPPGRWLELQTGDVHEGGQAVTLSAEPGWPPLLLREGHAVPLGVVSEPRPDEPRFRDPQQIEWIAFPDADGRFSGRLTWDDGVSRLEQRAQASDVRMQFDDDRLTTELNGVPLPAGFEPVARVLVPGGAVQLPWFRGGFRVLTQ